MPPTQEYNPAPVANNRLNLILAAVLIVLTVAFRGGNRHIPLMLIEWLSMAGFLLMAWAISGNVSDRAKRAPMSIRSWLLILLACSPILVGLLALSPLSLTSQGAEIGYGQWFDHGSGMTLAGEATLWLKSAPEPVWAAVLAGAPVALFFAIALLAPKESIQTISRIWIAAALIQAAIALIQTTGNKFLYFDNDQIRGSVGTFANRNHLANFIAMTLPWVILELRPFVRQSGSASGRKPWLWGSALLLLIAALLASMSRAGIVTGVLVSVMSLWLLAPRKTSKTAKSRWVWTLALGLLALALLAGGWDWLSRFDADNLEASAQFRENIRDLTWNAAMAYWPLGAGLGSFALVFPEFQNTASTGFVNYAHSDYLQLLLELGWVFVALTMLLLALIAERLWKGLLVPGAKKNWKESDAFALASGLGFLAIALHAWVDFPMRIPANAMLGAFLLGAFLRSAGAPEVARIKRHKRATST